MPGARKKGGDAKALASVFDPCGLRVLAGLVGFRRDHLEIAPFITLRSYRKDRPARSKDAWDAFTGHNLNLPDGTDMSKLRNFKNIIYHGVHHSNGMLSPEAKACLLSLILWS